MYERENKLSRPKIQNIRNLLILKRKKEIKDKIIIDIWILSETEEEKKERRKLVKKKEHNERLIKYILIRDIRTLVITLTHYYISLKK